MPVSRSQVGGKTDLTKCSKKRSARRHIRSGSEQLVKFLINEIATLISFIVDRELLLVSNKGSFKFCLLSGLSKQVA